MAASIFIRMAVGLAVFVVLARGIGPRDFGYVSTVFAYAALAGLLTDFGFALKTLRDIAANPAGGGAILAAALRIKGALTTLAVAISCLIIAFLPLSTPLKLAGAMIVIGILVGSIGDLALVAYRSVGRYLDETRIVAWTSAFYGASIAPVALMHAGVVYVGAAVLFSRLLFATVAVVSVRSCFPPASPTDLGARQTIASFRSALAWALDAGLNFVNGQVDGLVIVQVLGLASAGIYQSGSRFVQAALAIAAVLSNVHIPIVAAQPRRSGLSAPEQRMMIEFLALGAACSVFFLLFGPLLTHFLLGATYGGVNRLWPGFAAFVFMRYAAAAFGSALTARAQPKIRVGGQLAGLAVITVGFWVLLPQMGLLSAPWIMAAGALATLVIYVVGRLSWPLEPVADGTA